MKKVFSNLGARHMYHVYVLCYIIGSGDMLALQGDQND